MERRVNTSDPDHPSGANYTPRGYTRFDAPAFEGKTGQRLITLRFARKRSEPPSVRSTQCRSIYMANNWSCRVRGLAVGDVFEKTGKCEENARKKEGKEDGKLVFGESSESLPASKVSLPLCERDEKDGICPAWACLPA